MERRAFPRILSNIGVRFLVNGAAQGEGLAENLSAGGAFIRTGNRPVRGDLVVMYFDGGARLEGRVASVTESGFAVALSLSDGRRERLLNTLDGMIAEGEFPTELPADRRIAERVAGPAVETTCFTEHGAVPCRIVDLSLTGAALAASAYIRVGSRVTLGETHGTVRRRNNGVYGVEFDAPAAPSAVGDTRDAAHIGLARRPARG